MTKKVFNHFYRFTKFVLRSFIRVMFLFVTLFALLGCFCWFTVIKYFNAEHIGTGLTQVLQNTFNRPVAIGSIKLISLNAVEIEKLRIIDEDFDFYNELLSVDSVIIRYDLLEIVKNKKVDIDEIVLKNPSLSIVKDENGVINTSGLNIASKESASGQQFDLVAPDGTPIQITIEDWTITNGTISYRDLASNISHSLNGLSIHFWELKFNALTDYSLNFVLRNNLNDKIIETEIASKGKLNLSNFSPSNMVLKDSTFEVRGLLGLPLILKINAVDFLNPKVTTETSLPPLTYDDVSLFVAKPFSFKIPALKLKSEFAFEENFKKMNISSLVLSNKEIKADITALIEESFKKINISSLDFTGPDISLAASGVFDFTGESLSAQGDFKTKEFEVSKAQYLSFLKPYDLKGLVSAQGNVIYRDKSFKMPKLTVDLNGVSSNIRKFIITGVKGRYEATDNFNEMNATVNDGVFKVGRQTVSHVKGRAGYEHEKQNFYALLNNSSFNGQNIKMSVAISKVRTPKNRVIKTMIAVDLFNPQEVFDTVEDFANALVDHPSTREQDTSDLAWLRNFREMIPTFMPNISGFVYAKRFESPIVSGTDFNSEINVTGLLPGMKNLSGKIDIRLENGIIHKLQETADRYKALGIAFQPFVIMNNMERAGSFKMGKVLKDTPFEILTASADFNNGKMNINNFYLDGNVIATTLEGNVDWTGETFDLDIATMFKNTSKRGALSENLTDESGEPALAFRTSGTMQKPSVQMRSPKKTGTKIKAAREKGLRTDFSAIQKFAKEK